MRKTLSGIVLLTVLCCGSLRAQHYHFPHHSDAYNSVYELGRHEIRLSAGAFSTDQDAGISQRKYTGFDFPSSLSFADFLGYRYHLAKWLAIGIAAGIDYQSGKTTNYSKMNDNRETGHYKRCAYTIANDYTFTFIDLETFQMYGGFGAGYTYYNDSRTLDEDYYDNLSSYQLERAGPRTKETHTQHVNGQVTVLGIKGNGPAAFFFELGYGYKGIMCLGINARF